MTNPRATALLAEVQKTRQTLTTLDQSVADRGYDLDEAERKTYDDALTRMEVIEADLAKITTAQTRMDSLAATAATVGGNGPALTRQRPVERMEVPSVGEQIMLQIHNSHSIANGRGPLPEFEALQRSLTFGVQSEGISPTTIEGDLVAFVDANRYAVNASRRLPLPDNHAPSFLRPRKSGFTSVGTQAAEHDVLSSATANVVGDTVSKVTKGGAVALSEQEQDWTDPAMLAVTVQDLAERYAIDTDDSHCTAIETASTASVQTVVSLTAASDVFVKAVAGAAAIAYGTSKSLPDTLFVAVDRFFYLASLVDGQGRLMFPMSNVVNSAGTNSGGVTSFATMNVLGLTVIPDPNFTAGFWAVAVSKLVEFYEQNKGLLQIQSPSTLATTVAYRGYIASNVYSQGFGALETS